MGALYTHYSFGDKVLNELDFKYKNICLKYRDYFDFGLQGPDPLFHYTSSKLIPKLGNKIHDLSFIERLKSLKLAVCDELIAYFCGYTLHYVLDKYIHTYIESVTKDGTEHIDIESYLDLYYLQSHGKNYYYNRGKIISTKLNASLINSVFPELTKSDIAKCNKYMKYTFMLFKSRSGIIRNVLIKLFKNKSTNYGYLVLNKSITTNMNDHVKKLVIIYENAFDEVSADMENIYNYFEYGEELGSNFATNYLGEYDEVKQEGKKLGSI